MSEHIFRDAPGFGGETSEYERENNIDHYGTLHEEIVRCRDCKYVYHDERYTSEWYCERFFDDYEDYATVRPDGFCAWGERNK